ncbi:hypothetical protein M2226_009526 [Bradyrhizobium elkanii]|nr:hypothetical protein [Bradyrhizobium elkanii]MCW2175883.1 hypothetical protein [Bradyrhizobium elkanii]
MAFVAFRCLGSQPKPHTLAVAASVALKYRSYKQLGDGKICLLSAAKR